MDKTTDGQITASNTRNKGPKKLSSLCRVLTHSYLKSK